MMAPEDSQLDRLLGGKPDLGISEREAILEHVLQQSAAPAPRSWGWRLVFATAAVVLVIAPATWWMSPLHHHHDDDLAARGELWQPTLTLSCVDEGKLVPCALGRRLVFQVHMGSYDFFSSVAEAPDGTTVWLLPQIDRNTVATSSVLSDAIVLEGPAGEYRVHAVFSSAPLSRDEVRRAVAGDLPGTRVVTRQLVVQ